MIRGHEDTRVANFTSYYVAGCECGWFCEEYPERTDAYAALEDHLEDAARADEVRKAAMLVRVTSAPEGYDGFGTETVEAIVRDEPAFAGRVFRRVLIDPMHLDWQTARYASGLYSCVTAEEFERSRIVWLFSQRDRRCIRCNDCIYRGWRYGIIDGRPHCRDCASDLR